MHYLVDQRPVDCQGPLSSAPARTRDQRLRGALRDEHQYGYPPRSAGGVPLGPPRTIPPPIGGLRGRRAAGPRELTLEAVNARGGSHRAAFAARVAAARFAETFLRWLRATLFAAQTTDRLAAAVCRSEENISPM